MYWPIISFKIMKDTLKIRDKIVLTLIILTAMGINRIAEGGKYRTTDINEKQFSEDGIDFTGRGNEPFWSLAIDFEKGIQFRTMEGLKIETATLAIHIFLPNRERVFIVHLR